MKFPSPSLILFPALFASHASAASLINDFSSSPFTTETTDGQWEIGSGTYNNSAGAGVTSSASFSLPGIRGTDFTVSTQFTISASTVSPSGGVSTVGFGVLSLSSTFAGAATDSAYYLADFGYAVGSGNTGLGRLRVIGAGDTSGTTPVAGLATDGASSTFAIQTGTTYTLKLSGIYSSGSLSLALGLYDATGTIQYGTNGTLVDTTPIAGDVFGFRDRADSNGSTAVSFDNYALQTVPEPSVFALILPAAALLGRRRVRRA